MSKVTSKLQVTVPKVIADAYGIRPGDEIEWSAAGEAIRITTARKPPRVLDVRERLRRFDEATERQQQRERESSGLVPAQDRGWTREELYDRARSR